MKIGTSHPPRRLLKVLPRLVRQRAFARRRSLAPGEAAATALRVRSQEEIERHLRRLKCACGARFEGAPAELAFGEVLFGARSLTSARASCKACGQTRSLFFEIGPS